MKNMLGCGQLVGSKRFHRKLKGYERPRGDARGLVIRNYKKHQLVQCGATNGSKMHRENISKHMERRSSRRDPKKHLKRNHFPKRFTIQVIRNTILENIKNQVTEKLEQ